MSVEQPCGQAQAFDETPAAYFLSNPIKITAKALINSSI
jgi:hypothetical protein